MRQWDSLVSFSLFFVFLLLLHARGLEKNAPALLLRLAQQNWPRWILVTNTELITGARLGPRSCELGFWSHLCYFLAVLPKETFLTSREENEAGAGLVSPGNAEISEVCFFHHLSSDVHSGSLIKRVAQVHLLQVLPCIFFKLMYS